MANTRSTSRGIVLPPNVISRMSRAVRPASSMGTDIWSASSDILGKSWKRFKPEGDTAACWDFTKTTGNILADMGPNANDLTSYGAVYQTPIAPFGSALDFAGVDDYLYVAGNPASLQIRGELTVEAIVRFDGAGACAIVSKWDYGDNNKSWTLSTDGTNILFGISTDGATTIANCAINDQVVAAGVDFYIAGVYKPSTYIRLFVNGSMLAEYTTSIPSSLFNSNQNVTIGALWNTATPVSDMDGKIAMIRLTSRAKSEREIFSSGGRCF